MRTIVIIFLMFFSLQGQECLALQSDSLSRYDQIKELLIKHRPKIRFQEMGSKFFGFAFIVYIRNDSLDIKFYDNSSENKLQEVPSKFLMEVNEEYKLLSIEDNSDCLLVVPVLYKTYTSLDVPLGFEKAISNLFPQIEFKKLECLYVVSPILVIGKYRYTEKDCDFW